MIRKPLPSALLLAALSAATAAHAELPLFAATCPIGGNVDADRTGTVRVGGTVATVREFNPTYYEATHDGVTYSISHEGGGQGLIVSFSASGGRNGICTILSAGPVPGGGSTARGGLLPEEDFFVVDLSSPGGRLNIRNAPRPSGELLGTIPNGTNVINRGGCTMSDGAQWCKVQAEGGGATGWVAARFLRLPGPGGGESAATADDGGGAMAGRGGNTVRVQFAPGTTGTELTGQLLPGQSRRYVLGAATGQDLYFRLAANGPGMTYVIYNPDGSVMQDEVGADREFRTQLWQSGDHTIEVYNTANGAQSYNVIFGIE
ncbi:SH3 domain-containing protein [Rhodovulum sp. ES.010]|uniref:SH3 domain-containing protein n=1 Tax=Rhodovulum sp. ES.010 TaxID=1882821 RepID=UPI00092A818F|nr:SH3 domain-containing protein [Rhodovulum sp. ES.010]SIO43716.1 SH3 domain-containing protein [Rhodovulum sp. ES.010]